MTFKKGPPPNTQEPIEEKQPEPDKKPSRPRGRPRNDGFPAGSAPPLRPAKDLQPAIEGLLMTLNMGIMIVPPLQKDMMDEVEIHALSTALAEEAKTNKRLAQLIDRMLAVSGGSALFAVVGLMIGRRLARHGQIPEDADLAFGQVLVRMFPPKGKRNATPNFTGGMNAASDFPAGPGSANPTN